MKIECFLAIDRTLNQIETDERIWEKKKVERKRKRSKKKEKMIAFLFMNFDGHMASFRIINIYAWMLNVNIVSQIGFVDDLFLMGKRFLSGHDCSVGQRARERENGKKLFISFSSRFLFGLLRCQSRSCRCHCRSCKTFSFLISPYVHYPNYSYVEKFCVSFFVFSPVYIWFDIFGYSFRVPSSGK